jgi:hypothetical protein
MVWAYCAVNRIVPSVSKTMVVRNVGPRILSLLVVL